MHLSEPSETLAEGVAFALMIAAVLAFFLIFAT